MSNMSNKILHIAESYKKLHVRKRWWYRTVAFMAAIVVFCTTYALILPAITLAKEPLCGLEEHTHGPACYEQAPSDVMPCVKDLHVHEAGCYDPEGEVICGYADFFVHTHNELCMNEAGELICSLPEIKLHEHTDSCYIGGKPAEEVEEHSHTDACYTLERGNLICTQHEPTEAAGTAEKTLICGLQEAAPHVHTDACYRTVVTERLICTEPVSDFHLHGDGCYDNSGSLICPLEQTTGHQHTDGCYETRQELMCQLSTQGHTHKESCYSTAAQDHQHGNECYEWIGTLTCGEADPTQKAPKPKPVCGKKEAILHEHTPECYDESSKLICGKLETFEHIHTEACFDVSAESAVLICGLPEHTHDKRRCFVEEEPVPEQEQEEQEQEEQEKEEPEEEAPLPPSEDPPQQCVSVITSYDNSRNETNIILKAISDDIPLDAYTWQWEVSANGVQDWTQIPGATSVLYRFPAAQEQLSAHYRILGTRSETEKPEFFAGEETGTMDLPERVISPRVSPLEDPAVVRLLPPTSPDDGNYYLYYYGFDRGGGRTVVHTGERLEHGMTAAPYEAFTAPQGYRWDGKWYLDEDCTVPYDFATAVSEMSAYLTGAYRRDLYLYPGGEEVWDITFVSYGSYIAPLQLLRTESFDISAAQYIPTRSGYTFAGWYQDETLVLEASGRQTCPGQQTSVCYYAKWTPEYAPFDAVLRTENANDNGFGGTQPLGTWYAKTGSTITVETTGREPDYIHTVKCVLDGESYPVYTDAALTCEARLEDVYEDYFVFNNITSSRWTEAFGFNRTPYSADVITSGDNRTVVHFDYMRVAVDLTFCVDNEDGYFDIHRLVSDGLLTGAAFDSGTAARDGNVSASGVTAADGVRWSYAAASDGADGDNVYVLHHVKYGQRIADAFPTSAWITDRTENESLLHWASLTAEDSRFGKTPLTQQSRLMVLPQTLMAATGRAAAARTLQAVYPPEGAVRQAVIYAIECLPGETPDYTLRFEGQADGTMPTEVGFRVCAEESEVRYDTGGTPEFKELPGCTLLKNTGASLKINGNETLRLPASPAEKEAQKRNWWVSDVTVGDLVWKYAGCFGLPDDITKDEAQALIGTDEGLGQVYILHYTRAAHTVRFNFNYEDDGDPDHDSACYSGLLHGQSLSDYRYAMPDGTEHPLLNREGYRFLGWIDEAGQLLTEEAWDRLCMTTDGETMAFSAKWEAESGNVVQYYETQYAEEPFAWHFFRDGDTLSLPQMEEYPDQWLWTNSQTGTQRAFGWDVPMYGSYGEAEELQLEGQTRFCRVIRLYGDWHPSQVKVDYDANVPDGGIQENVPTDSTGYELSEARVPVKAMEDTTNTYGKRFAGWDLDRNGLNYQPGDYVEAEWMPTMTFTARWTEPEDAVKLVYDPNGGDPATQTNSEYSYERGADTIVWDNTGTAEREGEAHYTKAGHLFMGWNTEADGSGEPHDPGTRLTLQQDETTLYAQWKPETYTLYIQKYYEARADNSHVALPGAKFMLYDGDILVDGVQTTDEEGNLLFYSLNVGTRYTLIETEAPEGFVPLKKPLYFEVNAAGEFVIYNDYGQVVKRHEHVSGTYDGTEPSDQRLTLTIRNDAGYKMATTGGIGTAPYTLGGLLVVGAAVSLLMYNTQRAKRKRAASSAQREL